MDIKIYMKDGFTETESFQKLIRSKKEYKYGSKRGQFWILIRKSRLEELPKKYHRSIKKITGKGSLVLYSSQDKISLKAKDATCVLQRTVCKSIFFASFKAKTIAGAREIIGILNSLQDPEKHGRKDLDKNLPIIFPQDRFQQIRSII